MTNHGITHVNMASVVENDIEGCFVLLGWVKEYLLKVLEIVFHLYFY
jgi:hypothetical protein